MSAVLEKEPVLLVGKVVRLSEPHDPDVFWREPEGVSMDRNFQWLMRERACQISDALPMRISSWEVPKPGMLLHSEVKSRFQSKLVFSVTTASWVISEMLRKESEAHELVRDAHMSYLYTPKHIIKICMDYVLYKPCWYLNAMYWRDAACSGGTRILTRA